MLTTLPAARGTAAIAAALGRDGAVVVEDFLDPATLRAFRDELEPHLVAADPERRLLNPAIEWFMGKRTRHVAGVAARSRIFAERILCHELLCGVADAVLLPSCARYQLNIAHVLDRGPGSEAQLLHRDEQVWCHLPRPHPEVQVASVIALDDFDRENGATRVVPGSHRWDPERRPETGEVVSAEMREGSAVIYLGSTIHGGGANTTQDRRRRGMHLSFAVGWLRTEENHYLATPPDVARTLPRRAQELLGYAAHDALASGGGYLGVVDTCDPVELLQQGRL